jgi:hypothetical protein
MFFNKFYSFTKRISDAFDILLSFKPFILRKGVAVYL